LNRHQGPLLILVNALSLAGAALAAVDHDWYASTAWLISAMGWATAFMSWQIEQDWRRINLLRDLQESITPLSQILHGLTAPADSSTSTEIRNGLKPPGKD
jgi:hypothetical protein